MGLLDDIGSGLLAVGTGGLAGNLGGGLDRIAGNLGLGDRARRQDELLNRREGDINQLLAMLQQGAQGQGPSVAQEQLRQAQGRNVAQAQALARSARPGQAGLAQRLAAQQAGRAGSEIAGQSALLRAQEQLQNRQLLSTLLARLQGIDAGVQLAPSGREELFGIGSQVGAALATGGASAAAPKVG